MKQFFIVSVFLLAAALAALASMPDGAADFRESYLYETGQKGYPKDMMRADSLLRASAYAGYAPACNLLGYRFFESHPDSMLYWIEKAATAPDPDPKAFNNLGWLLSTGSGGVKKDLKKALYWYEKGAAAHQPAAMASLAQLLLSSEEVPADSLRARNLLTEAASRGFAPAAEQLFTLLLPELDSLTPSQAAEQAEFYYNNHIYNISAYLLEKGLPAFNPLATARLAQSYARGLGVDYDYARAMELFWHAALLGDPSAQFIVAETIDQFPDAFIDNIITDTPITADEWRREAAEGGITTASEAISRLLPAERPMR